MRVAAQPSGNPTLAVGATTPIVRRSVLALIKIATTD